MILTSEFLRSMIRTDKVECTIECRHGWPDIYHPPECGWQRAIEEIYRLEREDEQTTKISE